MGAIKKLNIELSDEIASEIDAAVGSGDYRDASDVVGDALEAWHRKRQASVTELRRLVEEGIESGDWAPWDIDAILAEERAKLAARPAGG